MISPYKIKADIYRLDTESITISHEAYIDQMMKNHSAVKGNHVYEKVQLLSAIKVKGYDVRLFVNRNDDREPEWFDFVNAIVQQDEKYEKLEKLNKLKQSGALTEEEFEAEKKKILG